MGEGTCQKRQDSAYRWAQQDKLSIGMARGWQIHPMRSLVYLLIFMQGTD